MKLHPTRFVQIVAIDFLSLLRAGKAYTTIVITWPHLARVYRVSATTLPSNDSTHQNTMAGLNEFLATNGSDAIGGAALGDDGWPMSYVDFVTTLKLYVSFIGPGARYYAGNVGYDTTGDLEAYHTKFQYVRLTKESEVKPSTMPHVRLKPWMQHV